jgi:hypothetical protein
MLHHAELNLCFWLMQMFEIFKFEFVVWLDLNSIEKIKRKGNRDFRIKEKAKTAQDALSLGLFGRVGPDCPRASALFLCARWDTPVGAVPLAPAHARCHISLCQLGPACQCCSLARAPSPSVMWAPPVSFVIPNRPRAHHGLRAHDARRGRTRPTSTISSAPHPHFLSLLPHSRTRRAPALTSHRAHNREAPLPSAVVVEPLPCLLPR